MQTKTLTALCGVLLLGRPAVAETTRHFELEGFGHFLDGNPVSTAVTEDGTLTLPGASQLRFADSASQFTAACGMGERVVVAQAQDAQVLSIDRAGKAQPLFKPAESLVTALWARGSSLFVATAPGGKIYRVDADGHAELFFTPQAKFVWQMTDGPDGSLLLVTGEPGTVQQVDRRGRAEVLMVAEQAHLRSVAFAPALGILVGGGERGVLYHGHNKDDFVAIFDSGSPEITAIATHGQSVFIAAVQGAANLAGEDGKPAGKPGEVRSQILRVGLDGAAETLAGSTDEAVFSLATDAQGQVLVATGASGRDDPRGRIYRIDPAQRQIALLLQSASRRITHLVRLASAHLAAVAAGGGSITDLRPQQAQDGIFLTAAFDAGLPAQFGAVQVLGQFPSGSKTTVRLRTGQTAMPDSSWSPWSEAITAPGPRGVPLRRGRFLQACVRLQRFAKVAPQVQRLRVAYRRQNMPPFLHDVVALKKDLVLRPLPRDDSRTKIVMVSDKTEGDEESGRRPVLRVRQAEQAGCRTLKWAGDDPNGDELLYQLEVRALDQMHWRPLAADLSEPYFVLDPGRLADGDYIFRVHASDAPSNPLGLERSDSRDSKVVHLDTTPPVFSGLEVKLQRGRARLHGRVADASGGLAALSFALDAAAPREFLPDDGLLDGPSERLNLDLGRPNRGPHTLSLRARDDAGNEVVTEVRFSVP